MARTGSVGQLLSGLVFFFFFHTMPPPTLQHTDTRWVDDGPRWGQLVAATSRYKMPDLVVAEVVGNPRTLDPITCMTMLM